MDANQNNEIIDDYRLICPECGVGNPKNTENCIVCDKDLKHIIAFLEDDTFDLEITEENLIEYRKNFWGTERTGKVNKYDLNKIKKLEFGSSISRLIFEYDGKRVVLPLREENLIKIKEFLK